jgi:hypothetical protein
MKTRDIKKGANVPKLLLYISIVSCTQTNSNVVLGSFNFMDKRIHCLFTILVTCFGFLMKPSSG